MTNLSTNFPFSQTLLLISELSKQMHFNLGQRHSKEEESVLHAYLPKLTSPKGAWVLGMVLRVVEFSSWGYKIRKIFA